MVGPDRGELQDACRWRRGGATDCTTYNDISKWSPKSIELTVPGKRRKGDLSLITVGQAMRNKNMPCFTVVQREEALLYAFNLQSDGLIVLHRADGYQQPCDDSRAKAFVNWGPQSKRREHTTLPSRDPRIISQKDAGWNLAPHRMFS